MQVKNAQNVEWRNRFHSLANIQNKKIRYVFGVDPVIINRIQLERKKRIIVIKYRGQKYANVDI